ncbi:hypothetical protein F5B18DRAFT_621465 [Nemania serpens]|nr:hypothetical protein F5B18DRAFT_621465 [Nemania serpens]
MRIGGTRGGERTTEHSSIWSHSCPPPHARLCQFKCLVAVFLNLLLVRYRDTQVVPIPLPRPRRYRVVPESVLEKVEDGELVPRHDISELVCENSAPNIGQRRFKHVADCSMACGFWTLSRNLQRLDHVIAHWRRWSCMKGPGQHRRRGSEGEGLVYFWASERVKSLGRETRFCG